MSEAAGSRGVLGLPIVETDAAALVERLCCLESRVQEQDVAERRYRTLLDAVPDMLARVGPDLRYTECNRRFCEVLGATREQVLASHVGDLRPELAARFVPAFDRVFASGEPEELAVELVKPTCRRWYETRLVPELDERGAVASVVAVGREVTERRQNELALRTSEERLRLLVEQLPGVLWTTDREMRFTSSMGAGLQRLGLATNQVVGTSVVEFRGGAAAGADDASIAAHRAALAGETAEYDDHFADHSYRVRIDPLRDAAGGIVGTIGVALDVTDVMRAERDLRQLNLQLEHRVAERTVELDRAVSALQQSEALFRAVLEQMPDALYLTELDPSLPIVLVNEAAARAQRCGPSQLADRPFLDLCAEVKAPGTTEARIAALTAGDTVRVESVQRRRDGSTYPAELTGRVIEYAGRRVVLILVRDITLRAQAQKQLRLVQSAVEQVTDSVVITDADLEAPGPRITYVNPAFERMTGYSAAEVIGLSPRILQGPESDRATLDAVRGALREGVPFDGEVVNYRKDGTPFFLTWHLAPIRNERGEVIHWVAIQRDVTEQKRLAELQRIHQQELAHVARLSTMGEMASGLAHELNQPLAAIANYARGSLRRLGTSSDSGADPQIRDALERIAAQAERSGQIIHRLRNFVRKRDPKRQETDVNRLVRDAAALLEPDARVRRTLLDFDLDPNLPLVQADAISVEQAILNLVRNAMEAMADTPLADRRVTIATRPTDGPPRGIAIAVRDHGPGIAEADLHRVFDPFYTTKLSGMGMGLAISRTLIEGHRGRLWASRNNGGPGATFHILLPLA